MTFMSVLEQAAGLLLFVLALQAWAAMNHLTRHCFRFIYGLIGLAGLELALDPLCGVDLASYARVMLVASFALHMLLDRRRIRPQRDPVPAALAQIEDPEITARPGSFAKTSGA
jgi:hypothetical protein